MSQPSGCERRANAAERGGLDLWHQRADRLPLARACAVCAHALRRDHGLVQGLRQIQPGQLGDGQGKELDSERKYTIAMAGVENEQVPRRLGWVEASRPGTLVRDAAIAYLREHGFAGLQPEHG